MQVGSKLGVADAAVGGVLFPLWSKVLGVDEQQKLPATSAWIESILAQEGMAEVVGERGRGLLGHGARLAFKEELCSPVRTCTELFEGSWCMQLSLRM